MLRGINTIIFRVDNFAVVWRQDWHNIAHSLSKRKAEGVDITSESTLADTKLKMLDTFAYDDF